MFLNVDSSLRYYAGPLSISSDPVDVDEYFPNADTCVRKVEVFFRY